MERWRRGLELETLLHARHNLALHFSSSLELDFTLQLHLTLDMALHVMPTQQLTWPWLDMHENSSACTWHACMQHATLCNYATMQRMQLYATRLLQLDLLQFEFNNSFNLTLIHGNSNFFMVDSVTHANTLDQYIYIICNIRKIVCF